TDPNDNPSNQLLAVKITTLPTAGLLADNGIPVVAGQVIPIADMVHGLLRFSVGPHTHGDGYATFTFQVQDNGGTANGGVDFDPTPNTITVNVMAAAGGGDTANHAPGGADRTV